MTGEKCPCGGEIKLIDTETQRFLNNMMKDQAGKDEPVCLAVFGSDEKMKKLTRDMKLLK